VLVAFAVTGLLMQDGVWITAAAAIPAGTLSTGSFRDLMHATQFCKCKSSPSGTAFIAFVFVKFIGLSARAPAKGPFPAPLAP
jgi:hypothetical protein